MRGGGRSKAWRVANRDRWPRNTHFCAGFVNNFFVGGQRNFVAKIQEGGTSGGCRLERKAK